MPSTSSSSYCDQGQMDINSVRCLINSISRFVHLVTSCMLKPMPGLKDFEDIASLLKLLKSILDNVLEFQTASDENLCRECEELDIVVNKAREFMENWTLKTSKIYGLVQSNLLLLKIQGSSIQVLGILCEVSESLPALHLTDLQHCMQKFRCFELESISEHLLEALKSQKEGKVPSSECLMVVIESLNLTSSRELLRESIFLEKERMKSIDSNTKRELVQIDCIIHLLSNIRDFLVKSKTFKDIDGVAIPPYFCCPLSLELMLDPVIVASGQTYERASIQRWLDHGLTICPSTRHTLSHTNLISNFAVRAMIANWCEEHKINLSRTTSCTNVSVSHCEDVSTHELHHADNMPCNLQTSDSTSRSILEAGFEIENKKVDGSSGIIEEGLGVCKNREPEKTCSSPEHSYTHSRSESASSAVSSVDYVPLASTDVSKFSSNLENAASISREITSNHLIYPLKKPSGASPLPSRQHHSSKKMNGIAAKENCSCNRALSFPSEAVSTESTTTSHVNELVKDLSSQSNELQAAAAEEIRLLAKHNTQNRLIIGQSGAIPPLISLLYSDVKTAQEHAVTALLNLSINESIKSIIAEEGALESLIHVLKTGNAFAKENAAATLFSISVLEEYRVKIGRSDAVKALVSLLGSGTFRGRKDSATALFNLSIFHENKARIVQAGAVKYLVELLDPAMEMVDKAVALLANLSTISEGCFAIAREGGIPLLVEIVESGTPRGRENAASSLLQLCISSPKYCRLVLQEGAVPPLVALSQSGTPRAKEKAQQLLGHFRNQRESSQGRRKS